MESPTKVQNWNQGKWFREVELWDEKQKEKRRDTKDDDRDRRWNRENQLSFPRPPHRKKKRKSQHRYALNETIEKVKPEKDRRDVE